MSQPTIIEKWQNEPGGKSARFRIGSEIGVFTVNCSFTDRAAGFAGRRGGWRVTITPPGEGAFQVQRAMSGQASIERHALGVARAYARIKTKGGQK